ncbi:MAG: response regulator [Hyphomicrobiaceae bacterium]|nr:response regulator [Hyphomicrobiaceae bacterium]
MTAAKRKAISGNESTARSKSKTKSSSEGCAEVAQRILVAEDSPVTQDLLKLVLEQRGHQVDVVADGEAAIRALQGGSYDTVLLDFHLPKVDGLEVATRFRRDNAGKTAARFVAITADIKGLLSHSANCENFDEVIPKPLDLQEVLGVIEREQSDALNVAKTTVREVGAGKANAPASALSAKYEYLRWPEDFNSERLSARGMHASLSDGSYDAIVLNEPATVRDLSVIWTTKTLHLLPIIDMTGSLAKQADVDGTGLSVGETGEIDRVIEAFKSRRAELHDDLVFSDDIGEKLIGRVFVSGGSLTARHDHTSRELVSFNTVLDFRSADKEIRDLLTRGLLAQDFFDRFHVCDRCGSSHFNVREECADCGSSHLEEEAYLHHFKCAYQGPESDFRQGDDLVCPKCRMELSHFSVDYDKPGSMLQCGGCGHATSEPAVGFVCMECDAHYDGDSVRTRDVFSYEMTPRGIEFAKGGHALQDGGNTALRFADLPLALIVAINTELKKHEADGTQFSLLNISYRNGREIEQAEGVRAFEKSREFLLEIFRNTVRKGDDVVKGNASDFILLKQTPNGEARAGLEDLKAEASSSLRVDLGLEFELFGPEDFS